MSLHGGIVCVSTEHAPAFNMLFRCSTTDATKELANVFGISPYGSSYIPSSMIGKGLEKLISIINNPSVYSLLRKQDFSLREELQTTLFYLGRSYTFYYVADLD